MHDLLAKALVMGIFRLLRHGIDRDYVELEENLAGVRGKINVAEDSEANTKGTWASSL